MSIESQEFKNKSPGEVVFEMQEKHRKFLENNGFISRVLDDIEADDQYSPEDINDMKHGSVIVLGTEYEKTKTVFLAIKNLYENEDYSTFMRSKLVNIGSRIDEVPTPNVARGYSIEDFEMIEQLYDEAKQIKHDFAPNYNIEQGIMGE